MKTRWKKGRPVYLDGIPATIWRDGGYALVRTLGRAKEARFAWGLTFGILETDGRFRSEEAVR